MENSSKIVCRKCKGPHLTIKCGKDSTENKVDKLIKTEDDNRKDDNKQINIVKNDDKKITYTKFEEQKKEYNNRKRKFHKVKLNYLPIDVTEEEILESLYEDCGLKVSKIKVNNYNECSNAYIEFRTEDEVKYIIESLHKTPFEHQIIEVEQIFD